MPSPFPGMDPYLESTEYFGDFHDSYIIHLKESLQTILPPPYFAATGRRIWVEVSQRYIDPDVRIHKNGTGPAAAQKADHAAVAVAAKKPIVVHVPHDERRETFVDIFVGKQGERQLVTTIEVLSPSNKAPGEHGRDLYIKKQEELLNSHTHLVEIDLLRGGVHSTAVPIERAIHAAGPFDYHVCIHRFHDWEDFHVYPIALHEPLPVISVPLLPQDPQIDLNLQNVFDRCYDGGAYHRVVRYAQDRLEPPLRPEQAEWAKQALCNRGVLPAT